MNRLTEAEIEALGNWLRHHGIPVVGPLAHDLHGTIERILADHQMSEDKRVLFAAAEALEQAGDAVKQIRENGLPPGVHSHPVSENFEDWLRARAANLRRERNYEIGDLVDVYDPDEEVWVRGTIETQGQDLMTIHTTTVAFGLPVVLAVPADRPEIIRPASP